MRVLSELISRIKKEHIDEKVELAIRNRVNQFDQNARIMKYDVQQKSGFRYFVIVFESAKRAQDAFFLMCEKNKNLNMLNHTTILIEVAG